MHELSIRPITCFSFNKDCSRKFFFFHFRSAYTDIFNKLTQVVVFLETLKMVSLNLRLKEKSEQYDQGH